MIRLLRRFCLVVGVCTLLALLLGAFLVITAGQWLQVNDTPRQADYILALAGDEHRDIYAADLFHEGYAPQILLSVPARYPQTELDALRIRIGYPEFPSRRDMLVALYQELDVPRDALVDFPEGHLSTVEESENVRNHLGPGRHTLLIVTSPYHARRAKLIFERTMPEVDIIMTTTPYEHFDAHWWADYYTAPKIVLEIAKCGYYLLGGVFRSTDSSSP